MSFLKFLTSVKLMARLSSTFNNNNRQMLFLSKAYATSNQRRMKDNHTLVSTISFSFNPQSKMDPIFEKFSQLWSKSLLDPNDKSAAATVNSQFFHKARLDSGLYQDMLDLLKEEFYNCKHNVFEAHLYLIEKSLNEKVTRKKTPIKIKLLSINNIIT